MNKTLIACAADVISRVLAYSQDQYPIPGALKIDSMITSSEKTSGRQSDADCRRDRVAISGRSRRRGSLPRALSTRKKGFAVQKFHSLREVARIRPNSPLLVKSMAAGAMPAVTRSAIPVNSNTGKIKFTRMNSHDRNMQRGATARDGNTSGTVARHCFSLAPGDSFAY